MLTPHDYKQVLDVINFAYSVRDDRQELFDGVFEKLEKLIGFNSAAYVPWNAETKNFQLNGNVLFNASPQPLALYLEAYASLDPYLENGIHLTAPNRAVKITDFVPLSQYRKTRYVREFAPMIPCFYEMNAMLSSQGEPIGGIALHRLPRDRDFRERDRAIVNLVIPHLSNVLHRMQLLDTITGAEEIGVVVQGERGDVLYQNREAHIALNGASVTSIPDPALSTGPVLFNSGPTTYRVRMAPSRWNKKWKIIYLEPQPAANDLQTKLAHYGLSKREQEIALWVMRGLSNRMIAERLFICEQTVKDHLYDVFEKMQIHRRSELTAKVHGLSI
jgi:DNA-binding CsgD family transcriptional regulator